MHYKYLFGLLLLLLIPGVVFAQSGKLKGTVVDQKSKEPLIGANIVLEGTSYGSATDVNGVFLILNVPPGTYTIKGSYVGYKSLTVSNVRVNANITSTIDLELTSEDVQVQVVDIVAERPLIQRNTTNTVRMNTQETIEYLPMRGVQNLLALEAGVVQQGGIIYVRGGREGDVKYYVEGTNVTNPINSSEGVSLIQEALEEVQMQSGGYTADVSGGNAGAIRSMMRTGGSSLKFSLDMRTDDLAKPGEAFLNTTSRGYRNVVATLSGPIIPGVNFFFAGQHNYQRNKQNIFLEPFKFDNLVSVSTQGARGAGEAVPSIALLKNYLYNNWREADNIQGNLTFNLMQGISLRVSGNYTLDNFKNNDWPGHLVNILRGNRVQEVKNTTMFGNVRLTHLLSKSTYYDLSVGYQSRTSNRYDPQFKDEFKKYVDSTENAALGYTGWRTYYRGPLPYGIVTDFLVSDPMAASNTYNKNAQTGLSGTLDLTSQLNKDLEVKVGGSVEMWTMRNFTVNNLSGYMEALNGTNGQTPQTFADATDRAIRVAKSTAGNVNYYGYTIDGDETDAEGIEAPHKPLFLSAYAQSKYEYRDLVLNFGMRMEYYDIDAYIPTDPTDVNSFFDTGKDIIDRSKMKKASPFTLFLPRVSFSFPVSDNTVFFAQYGRYAQLPRLDQVYTGDVFVSRTASLTSQGNAYLTPIGTLIKPEQTIQYEVGFRQMISQNFAFTVSGYYKDLRDQLAVRKFVNSSGQALYNSYLNEDFGTVKGLETTLELRRTHRLSAKVNYTLSAANGTGSAPGSGFGVVESNSFSKFPNFIGPLDFARTHSGSVVLDYRFAKGDGGPILEGFGVNGIFRFASGRHYTKVQPPTSLGQSDTYSFGVYVTNDQRFRVPTEPINTSEGPWNFNLDVSISKAFYVGSLNLEVYMHILNFFNTKNVQNVYQTTGSAQDDGWLSSPLAGAYTSTPDYVQTYRAFNLDNRYALLNIGEDDVYYAPREIRIGMSIQF